MNFASVRIITADIKPLIQIYELITGMPVTQYTYDFAELHTPSATLAIGSTRTLHLFGGDHVASAANNHSAIIEFRVDDVDAEYKNWLTPLATASCRSQPLRPGVIARYCFGTRTVIWSTSLPRSRRKHFRSSMGR